MNRAIAALAFVFGLSSLAHAGGGVARGDLLYGVPAEARWAPFWPQLLPPLLPACDDASVLTTISGRFAQTQRTFWNPALAIDGFVRVREIGYRANGLSYIPRRYCVARAQMNDLKQRTVVYAVGENTGIIGTTWGVEWCVVGLDPMHAYAPACGVIKPFVERSLTVHPWLGEYGLRARD
jgi:hypothetical protein